MAANWRLRLYRRRPPARRHAPFVGIDGCLSVASVDRCVPGLDVGIDIDGVGVDIVGVDSDVALVRSGSELSPPTELPLEDGERLHALALLVSGDAPGKGGAQ